MSLPATGQRTEVGQMISRNDFQKKQIIFFFSAQGDKLSFLNDNIVIRDKEGAIKHQSTCYRLFLLFVVGDTTITTGLIKRSKKFGFSICLMSAGFKPYAVIGAAMEGNTLLRKLQYTYDDVDIGRQIIRNKIDNQMRALKKTRVATQDVNLAIEQLQRASARLTETMDYLSVMGEEGNAARVYFPQMFNNVVWQGRKPRIKADYINATLDIGYTMLFHLVESILTVYGFDLYYGVFHKCYYMRKSLVCDIMEPMRPIVDYATRKGISLGRVKESDFEKQNHRYVLPWKNNAKYIGLFMEVIVENREEIFEYIQSYYRFFMKRKSVTEMPVYIYK